MEYKACILCAGKGSRVQVYPNLHKALLPLGNKAAISRVIDSFPISVPVVVALGYKASQVRAYLEFFHSNRNFEFVEVDNYDQPGSGPGYSLFCCRNNLQTPFVFTSVDTIVDPKELDLTPKSNWVGIGKVADDEASSYCLYECGKGFYFGRGNIAFIGMAGVMDYQTFWDNHSAPKIINKEHQVIDGFSTIRTAETKFFFSWLDTGNAAAYAKAKTTFHEVVEEKPNEAIFIENGRVAKFFSDVQVVDRRVQRASVLAEIVPRVVRLDDNIYGYDYIRGELLSNLVNETDLDSFMVFMHDFIAPHSGMYDEKFKANCIQMHKTKLYERIDKGEHIAQLDKIECINGIPVRPIAEMLDGIDWDAIIDGALPFRFHGDLQPENILKSGDRFILLDWRDSFGSSLVTGDVYYDLGKLYHAILVNGHVIRSKQFTVHIDGSDASVRINFRDNLLVLLAKLKSFCRSKNYNWNVVVMLGILQYINISAMHSGDYSMFLFLFGKLCLEKHLKGEFMYA